MKVFLILSNFPNLNGEAIEVTAYEVVRHLSASGVSVVVQVLIRDKNSLEYSESASNANAWLERLPNIETLDPLYLGDLVNNNVPLLRIFRHMLAIVRSLPLLRYQVNSYLFPGLLARGEVENRVKAHGCDLIASIWSWEGLAAGYNIKGVKKYSYYGNPDDKPRAVQLADPSLFGIGSNKGFGKVKIFFLKMLNKARKIQHLKIMRDCDVTSNNSIVDSQYYSDNGHPSSHYLQFMWPLPKQNLLLDKEVSPVELFRIVGSVGNLGATGNTLGLRYLGEKLLPNIKKQMKDIPFYVDIYGGGVPSPRVESALNWNEIRMMGWVDELEEELKASSVFLVLTNVDGFIVGNTRILLAWSLGMCVIAYRDTALAMPEIENGHNMLLADTPEELASLIYKVCADYKFRQTIGHNGYQTFLQSFTSDKVMPLMIDQMESCVAES